jgi:peptidoglycan/xylan/chitin deacetylase (PgdA/CDA1 family)
MRNIFYRIPIPVSFSLLRKTAAVNPLVVNYHVVSDHSLPHVDHIYPYRNSTSFSEDLDFLRSRYHLITMQDLLESLRDTRHLLPENSLMITFDDGLKEVYEVVAPILKKKKIVPAVFLTKNYIDNKELGYDHRKSLLIHHTEDMNNHRAAAGMVEILRTEGLFKGDLKSSVLGITYKKRQMVDTLAAAAGIDFSAYVEENRPYLTSSQIMELKDQGYLFGGHSIDHPDFRELSLEEQLFQAKESMDFVCKQYQIGYRTFAFPYWDASISREFFAVLKADATFGTQGLMDDPIPNHIQRIGFERFDYSAQKSIKAHYFRKILLSALGKGIIPRS